MTADLRPYTSYRPSGLRWLDQVPAHWQVLRIKDLLQEFDQRTSTGEGRLLSLRMREGMIGHIAAGGKRIPPSALVGYKLVEPGTLVMNRMRAASGLFGIAKEEGFVSPDYATFKPIRKVNVAYLVDLFKSPPLARVFRAESKGLGTGESGFLRLYSDRFGAIHIPRPPVDEQLSIVRFIGHLDRLVTRYLRAKLTLIRLLDEQNRTVVQQSVIRGLDLHVASKASDVSWLGDIPTHWKVISLGKATQSIQTGPFGSQLHAGDYVFNGIPIINPSHLRAGRIEPDRGVTVTEKMANELARHKLQTGDIVMARRGELGRCAVVTDREAGWLCGTGSLRVRPNPAIYSSEYLMRVIGSSGVHDELSLASIGATMDNLNAGMAARLCLPAPPVDEQRRIVDYINSRSREIALAVKATNREIGFLREYRTRLVTDIVTGRLDIRGMASNLSDEVGEPSEMSLADDILEEAGEADLGMDDLAEEVAE